MSRRSHRQHPVLAEYDRESEGRPMSMELGEPWSNVDDLVFTTSTGRPIDPDNLRRVFVVRQKRPASVAGIT